MRYKHVVTAKFIKVTKRMLSLAAADPGFARGNRSRTMASAKREPNLGWGSGTEPRI